MYRGYTPAQGRATRRYNSANYERLQIMLPIGDRDRYKRAAERAGESLAGMVRFAVEEYIERRGLER